MSKARHNALSALLIVMMLALPPLSAGSGTLGPLATDAGAGAAPMWTGSVWEDTFDDTSKVNTTRSTEVVGGLVRLATGETNGLVASIAISCPPGLRYDLVLFEPVEPVNSSVVVSVLNATDESGVVGYVNEPISGFMRRTETDFSIASISTTAYPFIRLQADLEADGTNRPTLLRWAVHFATTDEWFDDMLGTGKMKSNFHLNMTGDSAEVDLRYKNSFKPALTAHKAYPAIIANRDGAGNSYVRYPTPLNDGYTIDWNILASDESLGYAVDDIDLDGHLDLVVANYQSGGDYTRDSWILWGDSQDRWTTTSRTNLQTYAAHRPFLGDVDGDGDLDVLICNGGAATSYLGVWLNNGSRTFSAAEDINLPATDLRSVTAADLNGDGFEDVILAERFSYGGNTVSRVYMGGPGGPDTTSDAHLKAGPATDVYANHFNSDEHIDVAFATTVNVGGNDRALVFYGTADGPDDDYSAALDVPDGPTCVGGGDINGDGYVDIVFGRVMSSARLYVFWGSSTGFSNGARDDPRISTSARDLVVVDINNDGYDDVVVAGWQQRVNVYYGAAGTNMDGQSDIQLDMSGGPTAVAVAVGRERSEYMVGSFLTEEIHLPTNMRWDVLVYNATAPPDTLVEVSLLDLSEKPILGFESLKGPDVDLAPLPDDTVPVLHVKVELKTQDPAATPTLDSLMVNWVERRVWRDQFYGMAKVERTMGTRVGGGGLEAIASPGQSPQVVFTSVKGSAGYNTRTLAFWAEQGLDYTSRPPVQLMTTGAAAASIADVNGDGHADIVAAMYGNSDTSFAGASPMFVGTPVGWRETPSRTFATLGARDVALADINGDGYVDVVFAQEQNGLTYSVNSTLFWGSASGFNSTPDVQFVTTGASGVEVADLDVDGDLDIAFACHRDDSTTSIDSLVFLQGSAGFCATVPSRTLPTQGARAVASGDIDGDGNTDLVFANYFAAGSVEIKSYIYWGMAGGGFETTPDELDTSGAVAVEVADVDNDGDLDVVFANHNNNALSYDVDSYVYLNDGSGGFSASPNERLSTQGATGVAVVDLDGTGWKDLVFSCSRNTTTFAVPSRAFLGTTSGWFTAPDILFQTDGASDVLVGSPVALGSAGYMSKNIRPDDPTDSGRFHTLRATVGLTGGASARLLVYDANTWQVLATNALADGFNEFSLMTAFSLKEHPSIRLAVSATGLAGAGHITLDDLWVNWTKRVREPPQIVDVGLDQPALYRTMSTRMWVNVTDEYDPVKDLRVVVDYRLNGTSTWLRTMLGPLVLSGESWTLDVRPRFDTLVGMYDFRVSVIDSDSETSGLIESPNLLEVLNILPTAPVVRVMPLRPVTTSVLQVEFLNLSTDVESPALVYRYRWYRDGELMQNVTGDTVNPGFTARDQNWSVEVRAFDGNDEGPPATAWTVIANAPPQMATPLADPEFPEDTVDDRWVDLSMAFEDADGDDLVYSVSSAPEHIAVAIDPATGKVTFTPARDWHGQENVTFAASDGEFSATQTVMVTVTPVNDAPRFVTVNGAPIPSDPVPLSVEQGGLLVITVGAEDVEGDELVFSVNSTLIDLDTATGEMRFQPGNEAVGTLRYAITVYDTVSPGVKVRLNFTITVINKNDPPGDARVTNPRPGDKFKANTTFSLIGTCTDPDTPYGQVLNYTWYWNGTHLLGYGSSLTVKFDQAGNYTITLNVTDGEFFREASVPIEIEPREIPQPPPPPPPPKEEEGLGIYLWIGILVALVIIGGVIFLVVARKRAAEQEAQDEEEEKLEAFKQMAVAVKETTEQMEREVAESRAAKATAPKEAELEEIKVEGMGGPSTQAGLSMEARVTEQASKEVQALFATTSATAVSTEDTDAMRLESLKRKYQTAISRLPYGIPSDALKDKEWPWLASALASGEKKTLPDGREVTKIEDNWYFSDVKDASSFLKEHGAKPKPQPMRVVPAEAAPTVDRETLLAKLEERFILGQISEKAYEELKRKYQEMPEGPKKGAKGSEWEEAE